MKRVFIFLRDLSDTLASQLNNCKSESRESQERPKDASDAGYKRGFFHSDGFKTLSVRNIVVSSLSRRAVPCAKIEVSNTPGFKLIAMRKPLCFLNKIYLIFLLLLLNILVYFSIFVFIPLRR